MGPKNILFFTLRTEYKIWSCASFAEAGLMNEKATITAERHSQKKKEKKKNVSFARVERAKNNEKKKHFTLTFVQL